MSFIEINNSQGPENECNKPVKKFNDIFKTNQGARGSLLYNKQFLFIRLHLNTLTNFLNCNDFCYCLYY